MAGIEPTPSKSEDRTPLSPQPLGQGGGVYSVFDEVKSFDGKIEAGFYYIETDIFFPFKGAGWYDADLVYYACECKLIKKTNILLQYKSSTVLDVDNFKSFIEEVYNLFDNPKYAIIL